MTAVHIAIGVAMVFVNLAAGLGRLALAAPTPEPRFWIVLRAGQAARAARGARRR